MHSSSSRHARLSAALALLVLPRSCLCQLGTIGGDACLPRDVITLIRGEEILQAQRACILEDPEETYGAEPCSSACLKALLEIKAHRCYAALTQPQRLQGRIGGPSLPAMQGIWYGLYPASGVELLELRYNTSTSMLTGTKLTGNQFVRAGRVSWEASSTSCRVVSSQWANVYTPRWDPCTLTMWEDHISIDMGAAGGSGEEDLTFVRARAPLLFEWDEKRAPTYGFAAAFERCDVPVEDGLHAYLVLLWNELHHSEHTVVLDQILIFFPLLLVGGWQLSTRSRQPLLVLAAGVYVYLVTARLREIGYVS
jgi:hypothetical protein